MHGIWDVDTWIENELTYAQFLKWKQYFDVEPFGSVMDDLRTGTLATLIEQGFTRLYRAQLATHGQRPPVDRRKLTRSTFVPWMTELETEKSTKEKFTTQKEWNDTKSTFRTIFSAIRK